MATIKTVYILRSGERKRTVGVCSGETRYSLLERAEPVFCFFMTAATDKARFFGVVNGETMREVFVAPRLRGSFICLHVCFHADIGKSPFSSDKTLYVCDVFLLYECLLGKCVDVERLFGCFFKYVLFVHFYHLRKELTM